jgi:AcrR family transcriptional regulator
VAAGAYIVGAACALAREHGLTGWTLRDLARRLGMAAPSLYSYFDSKDALFDAMFAQGNREFLALEFPPGQDLRESMLLGAQAYVGFCCEDPVRYQLLFQRTIPGFTPSDESWALAQQAYEKSVAPLREHGLVDQKDFDLLTGVISGLVAQQLANEPDGDRWTRLLEESIGMIHDHLVRARPELKPRRTRPSRPRTGSPT